MTILIHPSDLTELQQHLLASFFCYWFMGEFEAAEMAGEQFDKLY